jgi:hypothetical protein
MLRVYIASYKLVHTSLLLQPWVLPRASTSTTCARKTKLDTMIETEFEQTIEEHEQQDSKQLPLKKG